MKCQVRGCSNKVSAAWVMYDNKGEKIKKFICHKCLYLLRYNLNKPNRLEHSYKNTGICLHENHRKI